MNASPLLKAKPARRVPVDPATCGHPPERVYWWVARDDTAPAGVVLCAACCDCGKVLHGQVNPTR